MKRPALLLAGLLHLVSCQCPTGWLEGVHSCFLISESNRGVNQSTAKRKCKDAKGRLASVDVEEDSDIILGKIDRDKEYWIGLNYNSSCLDITSYSCWTWSDGSVMTWTNWAEKEPNHDFRELCGRYNMKKRNGTWGSLSCNKKHLFICERDKEDPSTSRTTPTYSDTASSSQKATSGAVLKPTAMLQASGMDKTMYIAVGVGIGVVLAAVLVAGIACAVWKRKKRSGSAAKRSDSLHFQQAPSTAPTSYGSHIDTQPAQADLYANMVDSEPPPPYPAAYTPDPAYATVEQEVQQVQQVQQVPEPPAPAPVPEAGEAEAYPGRRLSSLYAQPMKKTRVKAVGGENTYDNVLFE